MRPGDGRSAVQAGAGSCRGGVPQPAGPHIAPTTSPGAAEGFWRQMGGLVDADLPARLATPVAEGRPAGAEKLDLRAFQTRRASPPSSSRRILSAAPALRASQESCWAPEHLPIVPRGHREATARAPQLVGRASNSLGFAASAATPRSRAPALPLPPPLVAPLPLQSRLATRSISFAYQTASLTFTPPATFRSAGFDSRALLRPLPGAPLESAG